MRRSRAVLSWAGCVLVLAGCGEADDSRFDADPVARATSTPSASVEASPRGDVGGTSPVAPPSATEPAAPPPSATEPAAPPPPATEPAAPTTAYDEALARVDAVAATSLGRFVTPSGNIYCVIEADAPARGCEIAAGGSRDVTACGGDAPTPVVGRVELQDAGAVAVCNTDTIRQPDPPVLAYGRAARVGGGDVRCLSEPSGVTCVSDTAGFVLRRGAYALLNP